MEGITNQLQREMHGITLNERKWVKKEFSIHWIGFEAWCETFGIQVLQNIIEQQVICCRYPKTHPVCRIAESSRGKGSIDDFTTHSSELLHIANVKEAYRASNNVTTIRQM
jgi:hypothetical protein